MCSKAVPDNFVFVLLLRRTDNRLLAKSGENQDRDNLISLATLQAYKYTHIYTQMNSYELILLDVLNGC